MSKLIFKIRCSAIGQIMTQPRTKKARESGELSQTAKTYCENWVKEQLFKRRKEFSSKQTEKGTIAEDASIELFKTHGFLSEFDSKNEQYFENDFLTGTPDIIRPNAIDDIKSSWDLFSFPLFEEENKNKNYEYQLQGYMELCDKNEARLMYCLTNTPDEIVEKEIYYATNDKYFSKEQYEVIESKILKNHNFDDIDFAYRHKIYSFKRDKDIVKKIKEEVAKCQLYIDKLLTQLNN